MIYDYKDLPGEAVRETERRRELKYRAQADEARANPGRYVRVDSFGTYTAAKQCAGNITRMSYGAFKDYETTADGTPRTVRPCRFTPVVRQVGAEYVVFVSYGGEADGQR